MSNIFYFCFANGSSIWVRGEELGRAQPPANPPATSEPGAGTGWVQQPPIPLGATPTHGVTETVVFPALKLYIPIISSEKNNFGVSK